MDAGSEHGRSRRPGARQSKSEREGRAWRHRVPCRCAQNRGHAESRLMHALERATMRVQGRAPCAWHACGGAGVVQSCNGQGKSTRGARRWTLRGLYMRASPPKKLLEQRYRLVSAPSEYTSGLAQCFSSPSLATAARALPPYLHVLSGCTIAHGLTFGRIFAKTAR